ncbi:MAG: hypothetical protein ABF780_08230 [Bifidobacterium aquikefiri]|uniref:Uncharacterized protein n=1 Tax=Bifidobacterium aquikefiri TaxID=1653207 RepID=A0A261G741_9BIFI|nr:hypothetical protein [Bifidobacterium aquikefiri]OZG67267.1 hypothetical protein BAQU_1340 [Bifidobacterium aquikefiri]
MNRSDDLEQAAEDRDWVAAKIIAARLLSWWVSNLAEGIHENAPFKTFGMPQIASQHGRELIAQCLSAAARDCQNEEQATVAGKSMTVSQAARRLGLEPRNLTQTTNNRGESDE